MSHPFQLHFWRHSWGAWSEPASYCVTSVDCFYGHSRNTVLCQSRTCAVCGKVQVVPIAK